MFGHHHHNSNPNLSYPNYEFSEFSGQFPLQGAGQFCTPPLTIPQHDSVSALRTEFGYTSSGSYGGGSPCSMTSNGAFSPGLIQRSISSHSLQKNSEAYSPMNASPSSPPGSYFESEASSCVRKAMSTGDLQGANSGQIINTQRSSNSPLANEMSILESMSRASPYSPEEKKERIERYRSKRNLRNFNKKIKYECRKTLADSRPRIRGRFARNDEMEKMADQGQWDLHGGVEEYDEDSDNWINFLDTCPANIVP